ncbi:MAG: hypothetical protein LBM70_03590 [Victivallales bacterium]|jgi:hypothetical protein|nr:hypothetical protein [Victivallales bacterium]
MKKTTLFTGLCQMFLLPLVLCATENLLPDGNFETPLEQSKWQRKFFNGANGSIERTSLSPKEGKYAVCLTAREVQSGFLELWSPMINLSGYSKLTFNFVYKCTEKNRASFNVIVRRLNNGKWENLPIPEAKVRMEKRDEWTPAELVVDIPAEFQQDKLLAFIKIIHWGSIAENSSYFDAITMTGQKLSPAKQ